MTQSPIINNPYQEPQRRYHTFNGELDYTRICKGRRIFDPTATGQSMPVQQRQQSMSEVNDNAEIYQSELINRLRKEIGEWRQAKYPQTTRVTRELLTFWFLNPEREQLQQLFFAQQEAIETAIWLNELADKSNTGTSIFNQLQRHQRIDDKKSELNLPRIAFKMATGTGKTVVMATLILYHFFNRQEYPQDTRFADNFLIVAPSITIRDRLNVLKVDTQRHNAQANDYYQQRGLVPEHLKKNLANLNSRIVIVNYHKFEPRALQGNKRSPLDGKVNARGEKQEAKESANQVIKRILPNFREQSRLLVINDEAHHCYYPKDKGKTTEEDNSKVENTHAAVWFTGLLNICQRFKVQRIYDLSATPYYIQGSGYYPPYTLFPWIVTDFGLVEAIESGLVKIPFLPVNDDSQQLDMPILRNLYEHVKTELPRKGESKRRKEKEDMQMWQEGDPQVPPLVKSALDQFYSHYEKNYREIRTLLDSPPVFIVVCHNTSVSKEIYKYLAGYERIDAQGNSGGVVTGVFERFSNFDANAQPLEKPPTLLIDSDALENSEQVTSEFKKVFAPELEKFKREYRIRHPDRSIDEITDAEILREVVNTVGKSGCLGAHIRCIVSVSMLTEGWDANTVTHIMGLRAFNSQLLCEQVAGRALRRKSYVLENFEITDERNKKIKIKTFAPEYAHIIGVPFKVFKQGETLQTSPTETHTIHALKEREATHEIRFPNVNGYRITQVAEPLTADFSHLEDFQVDGTRFPTETEMGSAFFPEVQKLHVKDVLEIREQSIIYRIVKGILKQFYIDDDHNVQFYKFNELRHIVQTFYDTKIRLLGIRDIAYKKLVIFREVREIGHYIQRAIHDSGKSHEHIEAIFDFYNPLNSTKYVHGITSRPIYLTQKSHVNYVVADTESWEQRTAKALEELEFVHSYVKNAYLNFRIPYVKSGKDKYYLPDFVVRLQRADGEIVNLILEITGYNQDKEEKRWTVQQQWLPAVNAARERYKMLRWDFLEIANEQELKDIKNLLADYAGQ